MISALAFTQPWLLLGLLALPVLWLILRVLPPAARRLRFPAIRLLFGLTDDERQASRTPWWLLALRLLAVAAIITGFAGPILNPTPSQPGSGPLLVLTDGGWADAQDWQGRRDRLAVVLAEAQAQGRPVALAALAAPPPAPLTFQSAEAAQSALTSVTPAPHLPGQMEAWTRALPEGDFATFWLSDGLDHPGRAALHAALAARGEVRVVEPARALLALDRPLVEDGALKFRLHRPLGGPEAETIVIARGPDPAGVDRELARVTLPFAAGAILAETSLPLPPELRNRLTRFEIQGLRSAGAVVLADDSLKRRKIVLQGGAAGKEGLLLLDQTHYLRQALAPGAELIDAALLDALAAKPDVVILADVAQIAPTEAAALAEWVETGGLLLRFAGPRLAASDLARGEDDPLMPVRLRAGGRDLGGSLSWGEPRALAPFPEGSPFHGLSIPADVTVSTQVLAEPGPELAALTIAALADGTPLVTRREMGQGQVVLVHVTANAEWSSLPLSGLFVSMLERLAISAGGADPAPETLQGQVWTALTVLDGFGAGVSGEALAGVDGLALGQALIGGPVPGLPPGLYGEGGRSLGLPTLGREMALAPAVWPAGQVVEGADPILARPLKGPLLGLATALLLADILAALWLSGRLPRAGGAVRVGLLVAAALFVTTPAPQALAQDLPAEADDFAIAATDGVVLGYVKSGDPALDELSQLGMQGLSDRLWERTTIEPLAPMGVDIETDELAFFPFLYWPVSPGAPVPSPAAYRKLNAYLATGGLILFDTRDGDISGAGGATAEGEALRLIALGLDIPPLEPLPPDHILTRSFYLIQAFPGRAANPQLWVEAAPPGAEAADSMPFRRLNDGVTPVVIGGGDWAAAWATDEYGSPVYPVGRGEGGERQREIATRFGINLIMHVLTGNYKSDQVHVPALLDRLGQ